VLLIYLVVDSAVSVCWVAGNFDKGCLFWRRAWKEAAL